MAMSTAPPTSTNSAASSEAGESAEYKFRSSAAWPAGYNVNFRNSAEQLVDGKGPTGSFALSRAAQQVGSASTSASSAEQPLSSFAPYLPNIDKRAVPDERGEEQPKKRRNHNLVMVSAEDFMMPDILLPIQTALAREIDKFKAECQQWDPPNFEEDAPDKDKPTFRLRNVYERLQSIQAPGCLSTSTPAQKKRCML